MGSCICVCIVSNVLFCHQVKLSFRFETSFCYVFCFCFFLLVLCRILSWSRWNMRSNFCVELGAVLRVRLILLFFYPHRSILSKNLFVRAKSTFFFQFNTKSIQYWIENFRFIFSLNDFLMNKSFFKGFESLCWQ